MDSGYDEAKEPQKSRKFGIGEDGEAEEEDHQGSAYEEYYPPIGMDDRLAFHIKECNGEQANQRGHAGGNHADDEPAMILIP